MKSPTLIITIVQSPQSYSSHVKVKFSYNISSKWHSQIKSHLINTISLSPQSYLSHVKVKFSYNISSKWHSQRKSHINHDNCSMSLVILKLFKSQI